MAFHVLIVVPLLDERPGGPSGRRGACCARAAQTRPRTGVHHTNPSASDPACQWPSAQPMLGFFGPWPNPGGVGIPCSAPNDGGPDVDAAGPRSVNDEALPGTPGEG